MSRYRVYIKPFIGEGIYADDFTDISDDVIKLGTISESLDNTEYDIGILKTSGLKIQLRNDHGKFSEANNSKSIFQYKREDAIVRLTWSINRHPLKAGYFKAGHVVYGREVTIFEGLLSDIPAVSKIDQQMIDFRINGYDSLISKANTPYGSISNGDTFSEIMYTMLNQSAITDYLTVSQGNITPPVDLAIDDKSSLENTTVREALDNDDLLLCSSSVLYIKDGVLYINDREATTDNQFTFYGQASIVGNENIYNIEKYRDGQNKIFNYLRWPDVSSVVSDTSSINTYGYREREISTDLISTGSSAKITSILTEIRDDFANPKREMELLCPINYQTLALYLKDKVNIDYPTVYKSADENIKPRFGQVKWGDFRWPYGQYSLTIDSADRFKIMGRRIDPNNDLIKFHLREV